MREFDGRRAIPKELKSLTFCIRNVGVGEVSSFLNVKRGLIIDWLDFGVPVKYLNKVNRMSTTIKEETYEFVYREIERNPWGGGQWSGLDIFNSDHSVYVGSSRGFF